MRFVRLFKTMQSSDNLLVKSIFRIIRIFTQGVTARNYRHINKIMSYDLFTCDLNQVRNLENDKFTKVEKVIKSQASIIYKNAASTL